jgi:hypothetical protein
LDAGTAEAADRFPALLLVHQAVVGEQVALAGAGRWGVDRGLFGVLDEELEVVPVVGGDGSSGLRERPGCDGGQYDGCADGDTWAGAHGDSPRVVGAQADGRPVGRTWGRFIGA